MKTLSFLSFCHGICEHIKRRIILFPLGQLGKDTKRSHKTKINDKLKKSRTNLATHSSNKYLSENNDEDDEGPDFQKQLQKTQEQIEDDYEKMPLSKKAATIHGHTKNEAVYFDDSQQENSESLNKILDHVNEPKGAKLKRKTKNPGKLSAKLDESADVIDHEDNKDGGEGQLLI